jgi:hypothetical protein
MYSSENKKDSAAASRNASAVAGRKAPTGGVSAEGVSRKAQAGLNKLIGKNYTKEELLAGESADQYNAGNRRAGKDLKGVNTRDTTLSGITKATRQLNRVEKNRAAAAVATKRVRFSPERKAANAKRAAEMAGYQNKRTYSYPNEN